MSVYPNRNKCFAHNYSRVIVESGAACDIGMDALCLCMHIAHLEDARHYSGPVKEWNSRLCQVFGVSDNKLRRIRDKAVEAGWLHYERGNTRFVGVYWALIPSQFGEMASQGTSLGDRTGEILSQQISSTSDVSPVGSSEGNPVGGSGGDPVGNTNGLSSLSPSLSLTPSSCPDQAPDEPRPSPPKKKPKAHSFTDEDMTCAEWIWERIEKTIPSAKKPNLGSWANSVRLMREIDHRTHHDICQVFKFANQDSFWRPNILSPDKLRAKFDQLVVKLGTPRDGPASKPQQRTEDVYPAMKRPE